MQIAGARAERAEAVATAVRLRCENEISLARREIELQRREFLRLTELAPVQTVQPSTIRNQKGSPIDCYGSGSALGHTLIQQIQTMITANQTNNGLYGLLGTVIRQRDVGRVEVKIKTTNEFKIIPSKNLRRIRRWPCFRSPEGSLYDISEM